MPDNRFFDSRYQYLLADPLLATLRRIYEFLDMEFRDQDVARVLHYLEQKPQGKDGTHHYDLPPPERIDRERPLFHAYQKHFQVPKER